MEQEDRKMVKIWIIYHTKHGNCENVCEELKSILSGKFDVSCGDVTKIKPEDIINDLPDSLIVGSRIIIGGLDKKVKKFVNKLGSILQKPISKAATVYTHCSEWDPKYGKMAKILKDNKVADDILPQILNIKMQKIKGPAEPGQENKIDEFVEKIAGFIEK